MKLVTMTDSCAKRFGDARAIETIKAAGFDGYDYSMFTENAVKVLSSDGYREYFEGVKEYADKIGLPCLQSHAPDIYSMLDTKEAEENKISVRSRFKGDEGTLSVSDFIIKINKEIENKEIREVEVETK